MLLALTVTAGSFSFNGMTALADNEGTVNCSALNIREGASTDETRIGTLAEGTKVTILETSGDWYKVNVVMDGTTVTGYVSAQYISLGEGARVATSGTGTCNVSGLNVRSSESLDADILTCISQGTAVTISGTEGSWYKVNVSGTDGYVYSEYITLGGSASTGTSQTGTAQTGSLQATSGSGVVNADVLNLRTGASLDYNIKGFLLEGTKVTLLEKSGDWYKVSATVNGTDTEGYVFGSYITVGTEIRDDAGSRAPAETQDVKITEVNETVWATEDVNIRESYSTSSTILGLLRTGNSITRTGILDNGWSRVSYNGGTAYIYSEYLTNQNPGGTGDQGTTEIGESGTSQTSAEGSKLQREIVEYALQFVGNPYVYGGNSLTNGVDCSGFTQQVYLHFGYSLYRSANDQRKNGRPVSLSELEPGDLLFYGNSSYAGHVTMYIGNGQVVHASTPSTGIKISPINYRQAFAAVRIVD